MANPLDAFDALLHEAPTAPAAAETLADWWPQWQALQSSADSPVGLALRCGHAADRIAWAFAGGYQAALRALLPALRGPQFAALCVTEATGNRPRDIQTRIVPQADGTLRIDGAKRWTTLGPESATLLVAGLWSPAGAEAPARPDLRVVQLPSGTPGIELQAMPPTRFVPEVPHAGVLLREVRVPASALLPGDGYAKTIKPFRTVEDIHVMLAIGACLLREARTRAWPAAFAERLVAQLALLSVLSGADPSAASTHLALAGALRVLEQLFSEASDLWPAAGAGRCRRRPLAARCAAAAGGRRGPRAARGAGLAGGGRQRCLTWDPPRALRSLPPEGRRYLWNGRPAPSAAGVVTAAGYPRRPAATAAAPRRAKPPAPPASAAP